ncbi:acyl-CoA thioesterase [Heliorestis acidaminivorans]|uniref:acyl-CoA thioesterase n=1 Tax=Heliorestis acidaminivorans TaxID=553427 RepID=UPI001FAA6D6C|nr:thioesterase family protein [Heliorestis acidaminivorans]
MKTIDPRFGDTDALGHINNTVLPQWFEIGREPVFSIFTPDLDPKKWCLIMANMNIDYTAQLHYGHSVEIRTTVNKIGNSSFQLGHEAWQKGTLCAKGTATIIHFDYALQKSVPIPEDIRKELMEHIDFSQ